MAGTMAFQSLREGFLSIRRYPVILLAGVAAGIPIALTEYFMYSGMMHYGEASAFFGVLILPFFIAAGLGVIREGDGSLRSYFSQGAKHYFRVLLPGAFIGVLALVSAFLVMSVLTMAGGGADPAFAAYGFLWVAVPLAFFFFWYDTAAVFEDMKLFSSLSRSAQFVLARPFQVLKFIMVNVLLGVVIIFGLLIIGSVFFAGSMSFDESLTVDELLNMTPEEQEALIGEDVLFWFTIIYSIGVGLFTAIFIPYKAAFYLRFADKLPPSGFGESQNIGVYDEKGRWYKYS
jgi:hypothetical protein